jgi:GxxExxY protein
MNYTKADLNSLTYKIIGSAIEVHKVLGPGLLESVYQKCLIQEFKKREISFQTERKVPILYKDSKLDSDLRCDFLIEDRIVLEIKAVEKHNAIYEAQLLTYMRLLNVPKGILINFNCGNVFREGQQTFVNELFRNLKDSH